MLPSQISYKDLQVRLQTIGCCLGDKTAKYNTALELGQPCEECLEKLEYAFSLFNLLKTYNTDLVLIPEITETTPSNPWIWNWVVVSYSGSDSYIDITISGVTNSIKISDSSHNISTTLQADLTAVFPGWIINAEYASCNGSSTNNLIMLTLSSPIDNSTINYIQGDLSVSTTSGSSGYVQVASYSTTYSPCYPDYTEGTLAVINIIQEEVTFENQEASNCITIEQADTIFQYLQDYCKDCFREYGYYDVGNFPSNDSGGWVGSSGNLIVSRQIQADWAQTNTDAVDYVKNKSIADYLQAGTNITLTGSGLKTDPYIISSGTTSGTVYNNHEIVFGDGTTAGGITNSNFTYNPGNNFVATITNSTDTDSGFWANVNSSGLYSETTGSYSYTELVPTGASFILVGDTNKHAGIEVNNEAFYIYNFDHSWLWPVADGTANQVLTTDGAGNLSFTTVSGGGSMVYPGAGIAVSTGSAWATSITDNSTNWNTAYSWGNHASAGYITDASSDGRTYGRKDGAWTEIVSASGVPHVTATGTDTYSATVTGVSTYTDGDAYLVRFTNGNTTSATLNINTLGAKSLYRNNDGALIGGDIIDGGEMLCVYNSTLNGFQTIGTAPNTLLSYVTNADSVSLTKGMPVYAFGGTGDRMTVKRALNTGDSTSAQTVGLVLSSSIAAGQKGLIMVQGLLDNLSILPTSTFADGDPIYLGATAGSITNVKPSAPNHLVYLGVVTTASSGSAGRMYVRVQNGYEVEELHNMSDTDYTTPIDTDSLLIKDVTNSLWKKLTWANVKSNLKSYFDTIYQAALGYTAENTSNKSSSYTSSSTTTYANTKALVDGLATKQDTLVSSTNIKTVNGSSILGSGNLVVSGTRKMVATSTNGNTVSNVSEPTISTALLIPANTFTVGDIIVIEGRVHFSGSFTFRSASIQHSTSSSAIISSQNGVIIEKGNLGSNIRLSTMQVRLVIKSSTVTELYTYTHTLNTTTGGDTDLGTSIGTITSRNIDWTVDNYILGCVWTANATDSGYFSYIKMTT